MSNIKSFPNNQDEYVGAEHAMRWFHGRTSGVFGAEGNATVSAVEGELAVEVADGLGWLSNDAGDGIVWWNDNFITKGEKLKLQPDLAEGALNRIDRVVVTWQTTNYVALPTITILKGTPNSKPTPPALTNSKTMRQISLAQIIINAGTITLTPSMIKDERLDQSVCGIVNETISLDTTDVKNKTEFLIKSLNDAIQQSYADMDNYQRQAGEDWEDWFRHIQNQLSGDVAGNLQNQITELERTKVTSVEGMGLSHNDFTNEEKAEVAKVKEKADKAKIYTNINIPLSGWSSSAPYKQRVNVLKMVSDGSPKVYLTNPKDEQQASEYAKIYKIETFEGYIEVTAQKEKPSADINIKIEVFY